MITPVTPAHPSLAPLSLSTTWTLDTPALDAPHSYRVNAGLHLTHARPSFRFSHDAVHLDSLNNVSTIQSSAFHTYNTPEPHQPPIVRSYHSVGGASCFPTRSWSLFITNIQSLYCCPATSTPLSRIFSSVRCHPGVRALFFFHLAFHLIRILPLYNMSIHWHSLQSSPSLFIHIIYSHSTRIDRPTLGQQFSAYLYTFRIPSPYIIYRM